MDNGGLCKMFQSFSCSVWLLKDKPKDIISITLPVLKTHIDTNDIKQPDDYQNNIIIVYFYKKWGDSLK